jgi:hypothetical protein
MKSRGFPGPFIPLDATRGAAFGLAAAKSWSRNRYTAARPTPSARMKTSEDEAEPIAEVEKAAKGKAEEKVVRLVSVMGNNLV